MNARAARGLTRLAGTRGNACQRTGLARARIKVMIPARITMARMAV
jgi:hypothetical protein